MVDTTDRIEPLRYTPRQAAVALGVEPMVVYRMVADGRLKGVRPNGKGRGKRLYITADSLKRYAGRDKS